jgi:hypothetical protein
MYIPSLGFMIYYPEFQFPIMNRERTLKLSSHKTSHRPHSTKCYYFLRGAIRAEGPVNKMKGIIGKGKGISIGIEYAFPAFTTKKIRGKSAMRYPTQFNFLTV